MGLLPCFDGCDGLGAAGAIYYQTRTVADIESRLADLYWIAYAAMFVDVAEHIHLLITSC